MKSTISHLDIDTALRALSDRTRLRILNLLHGGEMCVCDLVTLLDVPQPTASRHLASLRKAGLVLARKEGLWQYYRLSRAQGKFHKTLLECVQAAVREDAQLTDDIKQLRSWGQSDCCS